MSETDRPWRLATRCQFWTLTLAWVVFLVPWEYGWGSIVLGRYPSLWSLLSRRGDSQFAGILIAMAMGSAWILASWAQLLRHRAWYVTGTRFTAVGVWFLGQLLASGMPERFRPRVSSNLIALELWCVFVWVLPWTLRQREAQLQQDEGSGDPLRLAFGAIAVLRRCVMAFGLLSLVVGMPRILRRELEMEDWIGLLGAQIVALACVGYLLALGRAFRPGLPRLTHARMFLLWAGSAALDLAVSYVAALGLLDSTRHWFPVVALQVMACGLLHLGVAPFLLWRAMGRRRETEFRQHIAEAPW